MLLFFEKLANFFLHQTLLVLGCARQSCNVIISGRNLRYNRALQIVQNEAYLNAIHLSSILRRKRRQVLPAYAGFLDIDPGPGVTTQQELCSVMSTNFQFVLNCNELSRLCAIGFECSHVNVISGAKFTLDRFGSPAPFTQCLQYSLEQFMFYCPVIPVVVPPIAPPVQQSPTTATTNSPLNM